MMSGAFQQLRYLFYDVQMMVQGRWWRWFSCWFSISFWVIASYRIDRFFYLLVGRFWAGFRILLLPFLFLLRPWTGHCDIHYRADVGRGLRILHPALGIVISGKAICGENLILTGGNLIGGRGGAQEGEIVLGDNVMLGGNAVVLGPVRIGDHVMIGAGAVVVRDAGDHEVLVGVPAHPITQASTDGTV